MDDRVDVPDLAKVPEQQEHGYGPRVGQQGVIE